MKSGLSARPRARARAWFHSLSVNRSGSAAPPADGAAGKSSTPGFPADLVFYFLPRYG